MSTIECVRAIYVNVFCQRSPDCALLWILIRHFSWAPSMKINMIIFIGSNVNIYIGKHGICNCLPAYWNLSKINKLVCYWPLSAAPSIRNTDFPNQFSISGRSVTIYYQKKKTNHFSQINNRVPDERVNGQWLNELRMKFPNIVRFIAFEPYRDAKNGREKLKTENGPSELGHGQYERRLALARRSVTPMRTRYRYDFMLSVP